MNQHLKRFGIATIGWAIIGIASALFSTIAGAEENQGLQPPKMPSPAAAPAFELPAPPPDIEISGLARAAGPRKPSQDISAEPVIDTLNQPPYRPSLIQQPPSAHDSSY